MPKGDEGREWYVVAVYYPTAKMAKDAWERVDRKRRDWGGTFGVVRMGDVRPGRGLSTGAPEGSNPLLAVTLEKESADRALRLLRDGTHWKPTREMVDTVIYRFARVAAGGTKNYRIRRPDAFGATVDALGNVREPPRQG